MVKKTFRRSTRSRQKLTDTNSISNIKNSIINPNLEKTIEQFKTLYSYPTNKDVVVRNLHIPGLNKNVGIVYINTITNTTDIEASILSPLLQNQDSTKGINEIITSPSVSTLIRMTEIISGINNGNVALFIEGESQAYLYNVSNFEGRAIEKAENENVVKGPKEAFNEKASTNISLIRKRIKSENLLVESVVISERSKNNVFMVYQKDLVNEKLLQNVRDRLQSLDVNAIQNLSLLEQYIEERKYSIFPTLLYTERPDRATSFLEDGYIVLLMDNSPDCLVLPATFWSFYHISEEHYLRFAYGNFTRVLRILALFITLFTSSLYVAVVTYHAEMIPPDLLLAIAATRERVPFPVGIEVFIMELAFELIREAGLRVPSPIGPTIGIVGALILGQAAVEANIVSPIVVIIVALGGLSSFAIGDISMNFAIRISRFLLLLAASFLGLYGLTAFFTLGLFYMVSIKSFGVPYLSPLTPKYKSSGDTILRKILQNELLRPGYVKSKDIKKKA
ncbi:spore germination protein [Ornithinibacillus sp. BX22]|uniref:Spore germination protein n=2 Tax=Ornithinibacillus TaxID=484508 RepID=A0A923RIL9_9BACI|nr:MULTISPECIES: spore germination protein [Ornithinibacillus]MBC5635782.1 spore germination protein [Ornithinibacillus hominis]MBS3680229.1 spore germination protein [Ornithinibacillus massiliensis]